MPPGKPLPDAFRFQLDMASGVPVYRQLMEQVLNGIALGTLRPGDQLPTVRQASVDLAINPNTVVRAYRELEIRGVLDTHQGTGTFIGAKKVERKDVERQRQLNQIIADFVARAAAAGFTAGDLMERLSEMQNHSARQRR